MGKIEDYTGMKFGLWTVIERAPNTKQNAVMWLCKCDCGRTSLVLGTNLRLGRSKGCRSCMQPKTRRHHNSKRPANILKFQSGKETPIYKAWKNMKLRCSPKNKREIDIYYNRGIKVCDEWINDFDTFYNHVSKLPHYGEQGYSLDRIDNNNDYKPGNVRWATKYEQTHNRRPTSEWKFSK